MATTYINHRPWVQQYRFNEEILADITGWAAGTSLPGALSASKAVITKNRVYLLGGYNTSTVYTAPINVDGTLGAWEAGTSLPAALSNSSLIVTKNRVYLLGGKSGSSAVATVYTAPIDEDGIIGTWDTAPSLPGILQSSSAVVTKNRVYLLGGYADAAVATVYTAPINEDGTVGTWETAPSLPGVLHLSSEIVTKDRVYLLGGHNGSGPVATVYTAPINEDGTLGTWATGTGLPAIRNSASVVVTKNRVYFIGGWATSQSVNTVYTAPINEDGTLGTWATGTNIPGNLGTSQAIVTSSRIYLLGGQVTGLVATVYTAPFPGGKNDYSDDSYGSYDCVMEVVGQFALGADVGMVTETNPIDIRGAFGLGGGISAISHANTITCGFGLSASVGMEQEADLSLVCGFGFGADLTMIGTHAMSIACGFGLGSNLSMITHSCQISAVFGIGATIDVFQQGDININGAFGLSACLSAKGPLGCSGLPSHNQQRWS